MDRIGLAHTADALGTPLAWAEMGSGEALVLIHGLLDTHRTWRRVAPRLARRYRVLMPDLPGHGASGRPDAPYTLAWQARTLVGWLRGLGIRRAHVCGHSYGGGVGQWMLLEDRTLVSRLALVASGGLGRELPPGLRLAALPVLGPRLAPLILRHVVPLALRLSAETYGHMEPDEIAALVQSIRAPGTDRAFLRTVAEIATVLGQRMQFMDRAASLGPLPPIALFWGTRDPFMPLHHATRTVEATTGISLTAYEGCGHYPHLDRAAELALDLTAFLDDRRRVPARVLSPARVTVPVGPALDRSAGLSVAGAE